MLPLFQSTHPHGVRRFEELRGRFSELFQSTHPHGVRLYQEGYRTLTASFNPRTHTGCDFERGTKGAADYVSIHAPTRGATYLRVPFETWLRVSIHAPTRGATRQQLLAIFRTKVSIHAPTRGATCANVFAFLGVRVSIHAPTRGATAADSLLCTFLIVSIHAPTRGATSVKHKQCPTYTFQSTHPHGVRPTLLLHKVSKTSFNPRTHTGCD